MIVNGPGFIGCGGLTAPYNPFNITDSELKSLKLLKQWLSPSQLKDFNAYGYFYVIGSHTGRRYKVSSWLFSFNISEVTTSDKEIRKLCLTTSDINIYYPQNDKILAQKIALETDEKNVLKIANQSIADFRLLFLRMFSRWL